VSGGNAVDVDVRCPRSFGRSQQHLVSLLTAAKPLTRTRRRWPQSRHGAMHRIGMRCRKSNETGRAGGGRYCRRMKRQIVTTDEVPRSLLYSQGMRPAVRDGGDRCVDRTDGGFVDPGIDSARVAQLHGDPPGGRSHAGRCRPVHGLTRESGRLHGDERGVRQDVRHGDADASSNSRFGRYRVSDLSQDGSDDDGGLPVPGRVMPNVHSVVNHS
jgi:hypothetical protein